MSKVPRRPKGESGPATRHAAANRAQGSSTFADPSARGAMVDSFLRGAVMPSASTGSETDTIAQPLRTVLKRSETTKLKALAEIEAAIAPTGDASMPDDALAPYVANIAEVFRQTAGHEVATVRLAVCKCLSSLLDRSKEVKQHLGPELSGVLGPWLALCHDPSTEVAAFATQTLRKLLNTPEKIAATLERLRRPVGAFLFHAVTEGISGKPLPADANEPRALATVSSIGALEWVLTMGKPSQGDADGIIADVIAFVTDGPALLSAVPQGGAGARGGAFGKAPLARAALVRLLAAIVRVGPDAAAQQVAPTFVRAALLGAFDRDPDVCSKSWSALLMWLKDCNPALVATAMPERWADLPALVGDAMSEDTSDGAAVMRVESILSSLLPFVVIARKAGRWEDQATTELLTVLGVGSGPAWQATSALSARRLAAWIELWFTMPSCADRVDELVAVGQTIRPSFTPGDVSIVSSAVIKGCKRATGGDEGRQIALASAVVAAIAEGSFALAIKVADSQGALDGAALAALCSRASTAADVRLLRTLAGSGEQSAPVVASWASARIQDAGAGAQHAALADLLLSGASPLFDTLPADARKALGGSSAAATLVAAAGRLGVSVPGELAATATLGALDAVRRGEWSAAARAVQSASSETRKEVACALGKVIAKVSSVEQLLGALEPVAALARDAPDMPELLAILEAVPAAYLDVVPAWQPKAFADGELEDESEDDDEDDDDASDDDDVASGADAASEEGDAAGAADEDEGLSGSEAASMASAVFDKLAAICSGVPGAGPLPARAAMSLCDSTFAEEGDEACANGRPVLECTIGAVLASSIGVEALADAERTATLLDDCMADLEDVGSSVALVVARRGQYPIHALRRALFLRPTAAVGLALCASASAAESLSEELAAAWAEPLLQAWTIQSVLSERSGAALRTMAKAALAFDSARQAVVSHAGPQPVAAVSMLSCSDALSPEAAGAIVGSAILAAVDPKLAGSVNLETTVAAADAVLAFCDGDVKLAVPADNLWAAVDNKESPASVVALALTALRRVSAAPLNAAMVRRLATLRDASPRTDATVIAAFGEAMMWPCTDAGLSRDVSIEAERCIVKAYQLHHLPTNGKLGQRTPHAAAMPPATFRQLALALRPLRRGIARHAALFGASSGVLDSLRASTNLALFDACCELVLRLKAASPSAVVDLSDALVEVSECVGDTKRHEVRTLRASPRAVDTVAKLAVSLHFWLCSRPAKMLSDDIGEEALQSIAAFANRLSGIVLTESSAPSSVVPLLPIIARPPVKPMGKRREGVVGCELKPRDAARHMKLCLATVKSRLTLLTYLGAWYVSLSNEAGLVAAARETESEEEHHKSVAVEAQDSVYHLLDVVYALCSSRPISAPKTGGRRTFFSDAPKNIGFDFELLGERASAPGPRVMGDHLATCAIAVLALLLQRRAVRHARDWAGSLSRSMRTEFESFVRQHLSPALSQTALQEVLAHSEHGEYKFEPEEFDGALQVTVSETDRTVTGRFTADEVSVDVKFVLPDTYPLRPPTVDRDSIKARARVGVPADKWRSWMMQATMKLVGGGATLWQSIATLAGNIKKQVDGVEPCPICYSVISTTNQKLPEMSCVVCKNAKFHATCLYEWWGNSGQTSCPMCRSPWFSS